MKLCCFFVLNFIKNKELNNFNDQFKINKIINRFLLTGDKFMSELYLKQPGFTYSACGPFTKHHERIQKFRETGNYRNEYIETTKLVLLMMQHILMVKIQQRELFQIRFLNIELLKLPEIIDMMDIKKHQQVWSTRFLIRKKDQE